MILWMCVVNPCHVDNGGCAHECVFTHVTHYCRCRPGFRLLADGTQCDGKTRTWLCNSAQSQHCMHMYTSLHTWLCNASLSYVVWLDCMHMYTSLHTWLCNAQSQLRGLSGLYAHVHQLAAWTLVGWLKNLWRPPSSFPGWRHEVLQPQKITPVIPHEQGTTGWSGFIWQMDVELAFLDLFVCCLVSLLISVKDLHKMWWVQLSVKF